MEKNSGMIAEIGDFSPSGPPVLMPINGSQQSIANNWGVAISQTFH